MPPAINPSCPCRRRRLLSTGAEGSAPCNACGIRLRFAPQFLQYLVPSALSAAQFGQYIIWTSIERPFCSPQIRIYSESRTGFSEPVARLALTIVERPVFLSARAAKDQLHAPVHSAPFQRFIRRQWDAIRSRIDPKAVSRNAQRRDVVRRRLRPSKRKGVRSRPGIRVTDDAERHVRMRGDCGRNGIYFGFDLEREIFFIEEIGRASCRESV